MLNVIIAVIVAGSSVWVYWDATKHKIGKVPEAKGMFNLSAGGWAAVTLLLWIVGFPSYLVKRKSLIERASENPIEVSGRGGKMTVLSAIGVIIVLAYGAGAALSALPGCSDSGTISLVERIVNKMPLVKMAGAQFVDLKNIVEQGYNEESGIRSCHATLITTAGEDSLQYSIKWNDKKKGKYYVQAQIQ